MLDATVTLLNHVTFQFFLLSKKRDSNAMELFYTHMLKVASDYWKDLVRENTWTSQTDFSHLKDTERSHCCEDIWQIIIRQARGSSLTLKVGWETICVLELAGGCMFGVNTTVSEWSYMRTSGGLRVFLQVGLTAITLRSSYKEPGLKTCQKILTWVSCPLSIPELFNTWYCSALNELIIYDWSPQANRAWSK